MPKRIVCLTAETVETLYLLGQQSKIVGITGFATRPAIARKEKPKVAAYTSAKMEKILALQPDLVIGFSNLQADIAAQLIQAGIEVHVFNQRSIAQTLDMMLTLGRLVDASAQAEHLVAQYQDTITNMRAQTEAWTTKPKVYFEEWNDPLIAGIAWVSEAIEIAGGVDIFAELRQHQHAGGRIVSADEVCRRQPDVIIGSWCGKKFQPEHLLQRPGWSTIPAVQHGALHEIKSVDILQPGPSLFTHGFPKLHAILHRWVVAQQFSKHWSQ